MNSAVQPPFLMVLFLIRNMFPLDCDGECVLLLFLICKLSEVIRTELENSPEERKSSQLKLEKVAQGVRPFFNINNKSLDIDSAVIKSDCVT